MISGVHISQRCLFMTLVVLCIFCGAANAQHMKLAVSTQKCDMGRIVHPSNLSVSVFDADKVPEIAGAIRELKAEIALLNSDPEAIQKAEALYDRLQRLAANTPALARSRTLPQHPFELPPVQRVLVLAFEKSEFESFTYATTELEVSFGHLNHALLNLSSQEDCKVAK